MAIELKEIYKLIDFNPEKEEEVTIAQITDHLQNNFVGLAVAHERGEVINKVQGKKLGELSTKLKIQFEELGVNFEGKDIKDGDRVSFDKVLEVGTLSLKDEIKNYKESGSKTDDKKLIELQGKIDRIQSDYSTVLGERDSLKTLVEQKDGEFVSYKKNTILSEKKNSVKSKIKYSDDWDVYRKRGFEAAFDEKYSIDLSDENDSEDGLRIVNSATKQRVSKGNKFVTYEDLLKTELAEAKGLKMNEGTPAPQPIRFGGNGNGNGQNKEVKINPMAELIAKGENNI